MVQVKWEPFRELMAMQNRMTRLFDETLTRVWKAEGMPRDVWSPPVDIVEREKELVIKMDLPEVRLGEIDIHVGEDNTLIIQGERKFVKEAPDEAYLQIERHYGVYQRTFNLSPRIDKEQIKASYRDGVLQIVLPKKEAARPRQITLE